MLTSLIAATAISGGAAAAPSPTVNSRAVNSAISAQCLFYGYSPGTRDFAACRQNVRIYWNAGPCSNPQFAAVHLRYCNIAPEIDF